MGLKHKLESMEHTSRFNSTSNREQKKVENATKKAPSCSFEQATQICREIASQYAEKQTNQTQQVAIKDYLMSF